MTLGIPEAEFLSLEGRAQSELPVALGTRDYQWPKCPLLRACKSLERMRSSSITWHGTSARW